MKLFSFVATLSCTGIMAVSSLGAIAETVPNLQNKSDSRMSTVGATAEESAMQKSDRVEQQNLAPNNPQNREKSSYSIFSFAKDKQITLDNIKQNPELENVEWYIEKFEHIQRFAGL